MAKRRTPITETPIEAPTAERVTTPKVTKADAVRAAVTEGKAKPQDGVQWIKERFGIDLNPQHFSSIKSQQAKKGSGTSEGGRRGRQPSSAGVADRAARPLGTAAPATRSSWPRLCEPWSGSTGWRR